jgi:hypothetical protein
MIMAIQIMCLAVVAIVAFFATTACPLLWGLSYDVRCAVFYATSAIISKAARIFVAALAVIWSFVRFIRKYFGTWLSILIFANLMHHLYVGFVSPSFLPCQHSVFIPGPSGTVWVNSTLATAAQFGNPSAVSPDWTHILVLVGLLIALNNQTYGYVLAHEKFLRHYYDQDCSRKYGRRKWRRLVRKSRAAMIKFYQISEDDELNFQFDFGPDKFELQAGFDPTFVFQLLFDEVSDYKYPGGKHGETIGDIADVFIPFPKIRKFLRTMRDVSKKYTGVSLVAWFAFFLAQLYRRSNDSESRRDQPNETNMDKITRFWIRWCYVQSALTLSFHSGFALGSFVDAVFGVRQNPNYVPQDCAEEAPPPPHPDAFDFQAGDDPSFDFNSLKNLFFKMDTVYVLRSTLRVVIALSFVIAATGTGVSMASALSSATEDPLFKKIGSAKPMDLITDVINLVNRVVEVCHTGNYASLFSTDPVLSDLNGRYSWFIGIDPTDLDSGVASPYSDKPVFTHEFLKFGETLIADLTARKNLERSKFASNTLRHWSEKLDKAVLHLKIITQRNDTLGLHESPYCVLIPGASAIGKSFLWYIFHRVGCLAYGIPSDDSYTYTVNDTHKHWDGFASSMHTLLWDDDS